MAEVTAGDIVREINSGGVVGMTEAVGSEPSR